MIYYTGDLHLGHKNALEFDSRPFETVDEMANTIIDNWNRTVTDDDHIYMNGDIVYRSAVPPHAYIERLRGHKHLILGNHDHKQLMSDSKAMGLFESVDHYARIVDERRIVIVCHYPIISWDMKRHGSIHVYGHVHTRINVETLHMLLEDNAYNAGCMVNDYKPCTLEELAENKRKFMAAHIPGCL